MRERVLKGGHFLTAVLNLAGDLWGLQCLANVRERRTLLGSLTGGAVAIRAAFIAEEGCARSFLFLVGSGLSRGNDRLKEQEKDR